MSSKKDKYILKSIDSIKSYVINQNSTNHIIPDIYLEKLEQYGGKMSTNEIVLEVYVSVLNIDNVTNTNLNRLLSILLLCTNDLSKEPNLRTLLSNIYVDVLLTLIITSCNNNIDSNLLNQFTKVILDNFIDYFDPKYSFPLTQKMSYVSDSLLAIIKLLNRNNKSDLYVNYLKNRLSVNENKELNQQLGGLYKNATDLNKIPNLNVLNYTLLNMLGGTPSDNSSKTADNSSKTADNTFINSDTSTDNRSNVLDMYSITSRSNNQKGGDETKTQPNTQKDNNETNNQSNQNNRSNVLDMYSISSQSNNQKGGDGKSTSKSNNQNQNKSNTNKLNMSISSTTSKNNIDSLTHKNAKGTNPYLNSETSTNSTELKPKETKTGFFSFLSPKTTSETSQNNINLLTQKNAQGINSETSINSTELKTKETKKGLFNVLNPKTTSESSQKNTSRSKRNYQTVDLSKIRLKNLSIEDIKKIAKMKYTPNKKLEASLNSLFNSL
jgi:hypothetical protein